VAEAEPALCHAAATYRRPSLLVCGESDETPPGTSTVGRRWASPSVVPKLVRVCGVSAVYSGGVQPELSRGIGTVSSVDESGTLFFLTITLSSVMRECDYIYYIIYKAIFL
jgi:hypothetical protein